MPTSAIASLAILKVNWDRLQKDYIENFVPLIAECIRISHDEVVSLPSLQADIRKHFGLNLPQSVISSVLSRASKRGYITLDFHAYRKNEVALAKLSFSQVQNQVVVEYEALITALREFAASKFDIRWGEDEAEAALLAFLENNQLSVSSATTRGTVLPSTQPPSKNAAYVVGTFARHLQATFSSHLAFLETIAKGNMLANAVFLPEPAQASRKFRNTKVFFDTTFLIYALGYAGETRRAPTIELIDLLYETGADLRCFQHTLEEIRGALDACAARIIKGDYKITRGAGIPTFEYFLTKGYSASDLQILISKVEDSLKAMRIKVEDKPEYIHKYVIDETALSEKIKAEMSYQNPRALERDVDSISAIVRLRKFEAYYFVEESRALFVTTNSNLTRIATQFFKQDDEIQGVSPCLTDFTLTNLLWLKRPTKAPDLPRKRIIADCFAATQPSDQLWTLYLSEIDKLEQSKQINPNDYYILRYSMEAKSFLMNLTLGQEQAFTRATVTEILANVKDVITVEIRAELQQSESIRMALETREVARKERIQEIAQKTATITIRLVEWMAFLLIIGSGIVAFPWSHPLFHGACWRYALTLLALIILVLSSANLVLGTTIRTLLRGIELSIKRRLIAMLDRVLGERPSETPVESHLVR